MTIVDVLTTLLRHDPYFSLGPSYATAMPGDRPVPLPPALASLSPWTLHVVRSVGFLVLIQTSLNCQLLLHDLVQCHLVSMWLPTRREAWWNPTHFGNAMAVFDRGLAGFWGAWWHQSFRTVFTAPTEYLIRRGFISGPRSVGAVRANMLFPFLISASMHAAGSYMAPGPAEVWQPFAFFALAGLGVTVQRRTCALLDAIFDDKIPRISSSKSAAEHLYMQNATVPVEPPRKHTRRRPRRPLWLRRAGNIAFVVVWMQLTCGLFMDDMTSWGFLLFELTPFSLARAAGLGRVGDGGVVRRGMVCWWHWGRACGRVAWRFDL